MKADTERMSGAKLGESVMSYLGQFSPNIKDGTKTDDRAARNKRYNTALFKFVSRKKTDADIVPVASQQTGNVSTPKISNLLSDMSKEASEDGTKRHWSQYTLGETQDWIRKATLNNPLILGGLLAIPAGFAGWGLSKWLNPTDTKDMTAEAKTYMDEMIKYSGLDQDKLTPAQRRDFARKAVSKARSNETKKHVFTGAGVGLGAWALNSLLHYDSRGTESLFKYLPKKASMLGPSPILPTEIVRDAVMYNDGLSPWTKLQTINMLQSAPEPYVTSTDIVNTAVETGASALANKPLGRIAVASAADYLLGTGIGSILGLSKPGRLGAILGIGTAINNLSN